MAPKITEIHNFWYKFAENGYTALCDFYKIWIEGGSPRSAPACQISSFWLQNCGPTASKIAIFINLPLRENLGGSQKKLNIGAQLQTFLYAMTP